MPSSTPLREVMTTEIVTADPDLSLPAAADLLAEHGIGAVPVVESGGRVVGLLRDEDLLVTEARLHAPTTIAILGVDFTLPTAIRHYDEDLRKAVGSTVSEVMETEFPTLGSDATVEDAATLMHEADVTHVVVVDDDGRPSGIVARGDLVRFLSRST
jgi:predicted transcriptional regulator